VAFVLPRVYQSAQVGLKAWACDQKPLWEFSMHSGVIEKCFDPEVSPQLFKLWISSVFGILESWGIYPNEFFPAAKDSYLRISKGVPLRFYTQKFYMNSSIALNSLFQHASSST
jgi:hypothetical protein